MVIPSEAPVLSLSTEGICFLPSVIPDIFNRESSVFINVFGAASFRSCSGGILSRRLPGRIKCGGYKSRSKATLSGFEGAVYFEVTAENDVTRQPLDTVRVRKI